MVETARTHTAPFVLGVRQFVVLRHQQPLFASVNFCLHKGESLLVRAPNGGGKTSLLRCLYGLALDYLGVIEFQPPGEPIRSSTAGSVAYMNDRAGVFGHLSVEENLRYMLVLQAVSLSKHACQTALVDVGLASMASQRGHCLSKGQKKRLHLARLLLANTPLWLLDEPVDGLDSQGKQFLSSMLSQHCDQGGVVVMSSHAESALSFQTSHVLDLVHPHP